MPKSENTVTLPKEIHESLMKIAKAVGSEQLAQEDPLKFLSELLQQIEVPLSRGYREEYLFKVLLECAPWAITRREETAALKKKSAA